MHILRCAPFLLAMASLVSACLDRPVVDDRPRGIVEARTARLETQPQVDGLDVVIVVDDSVSMRDKQAVLVKTLAALDHAPVACVEPYGDPDLEPQIVVPTEGDQCPEGWTFWGLSFDHVAVISTSMEGGGPGCSETSRAGHPLPQPASVDETEFPVPYLQSIHDLDEEGCGYEAPLEALYRFLVDPEPPLRVTTKKVNGVVRTVAEGLDSQLLEERAAFVRPLSKILVLILTDEDDCSVKDSGDAWKVSADPGLARGTAACAASPSDPCCRPCDTVETVPPPGCAPVSEDPNCAEAPRWLPEEDPLNLRCYDQRRRFGADWLFPVDRYVRGLREPTVLTRDGDEVPNPLFALGRTPDMVSVLLLSGTPWQLITSAQSQESEDVMDFLLPDELEARDTWSQILGSPEEGVVPLDPHLIQSVDPRPGLPLAGEAWDPIHGHEVVWPNRDALQSSCIFELPEPRECDADHFCLCKDAHTEVPACRADDGTYGSTQYRAQAQPSPRLLEFIRGLDGQGFLGSVCPRHLRLSEGAFPEVGFGYSDAVMTAVHAIGTPSNTPCFPVPLPVTDTGKLRCRLLELHEGLIECSELGQRVPPAAYVDRMTTQEHRDDPSRPVTICEIPPLPGSLDDADSDLYHCANDLHPKTKASGYCYIDASLGFGNPDLVTNLCTSGHERWVRAIPARLSSTVGRPVLYCDYE